MKFCFCVFLAASAAAFVLAQDAKDDDDSFPNYYDNFYDYDQLKEEGEKIEAELDNLKIKNMDVKEYINKINEDFQSIVDKDDRIDGIDDYQFEDNRDKKEEEKKDIPADNDNSFEADDDTDTDDNDAEKRISDAKADYALLWGDDSVAPLPVPEAEPDKDIIEETQKILEDDADGFESEINKAIANAETFAESKPDDKIVDETKKILEETDDSFNNSEIKTDDKADSFESEINKAIANAETFAESKPDDKIVDETKKILEETDDSFNESEIKTDDKAIETEKVMDDNDIDELLKKIADQIESDSQLDEELKPIDNLDTNIKIPIEKVVDEETDVKEDENVDNILNDIIDDNEDEDTVDKAYEDLNSDLDKLFATLDKLSDDGAIGDEKLEEVFDKLDDHFFKDDDTNVEGSEELVENVKENKDYDEVDFNKILEDIINEDDIKDNGPNIDLNVQLKDEMNEPNPDDAIVHDVESLSDGNAEPILYLDAIVDESKNAESIENKDDSEKAENASVEVSGKYSSIVPEAEKFGTVDIESLNSEEMEGLVKQFAIAHSEDLDVHADSFDQNVAPVHIVLNVDTPEVVMSPNYPSPYPTNNIIDWVFEGEGVGIEMNITDFVVNGALGDYLLVKPGGVDEYGHDGLLFTYRLNSEKRFRFTDVDKLFVRFEARPGFWNNMRGFKFSVKMISPLPEEAEPIPAPEPVLSPPHSLHTIYLASAIPQFNIIKETFRLMLADMAEEYIAENNIEPGLNTTAEVTQITSVYSCPVTWPSYHLCAAVTYGISLSYDEEDPDDMLDADSLQDMWNTYKTRDPYALRLRQMGIAEFEPPSSSVLTAWLVIASGVVISMVMLAFVLWRFSCFEDYTRMKTFSDTDSIQNEKRGLDLYPTPHQTLPSLYAENEYKWQDNEDTTRVDLGGFANKSYARDMYDFDSDEEVITPRDRNGAVTARDIYGGSVA